MTQMCNDNPSCAFLLFDVRYYTNSDSKEIVFKAGFDGLRLPTKHTKDYF